MPPAASDSADVQEADARFWLQERAMSQPAPPAAVAAAVSFA